MRVQPTDNIFARYVVCCVGCNTFIYYSNSETLSDAMDAARNHWKTECLVQHLAWTNGQIIRENDNDDNMADRGCSE